MSRSRGLAAARSPLDAAPLWERLFGVELRSLALFRMGLGAVLLADLAYRSLDLRAHATEAGVLPRAAHALLPGAADLWSLHWLAPGVGGQLALGALAAAAASCLGLGWHTRSATFVSWVLLTSLHNRNPLILVGGDHLLRLLLFWSLFLPLGARLSLDSRGRPDGREGATFVSVASAALLLQVALVYPFAAAFKRREEVWQSLAFLERAMGVDGVATDLGQRLLAFPDLLPWLSWLALQLESFGWLLAFSPWATGPLRTLAAAVFIAFHAGAIAATFHVGLFPWISAVAWLPFLPAWLWRRLGAGATGPAPGGRSRGPAAALVAGACLIAVLAHNLDSLDPGGPWRSPWVWRVGRALRLDQSWSLWSRVMSDRHYVFAARLRDGRQLDLHRDGAPLDWSAPRRRSENNHWWKYQLWIASEAGRPHRAAYAAWLRLRWDERHPPPEQVTSLALWKLEERTEGAPRRVLLHAEGDEPPGAHWFAAPPPPR